jgi:hypothetical protein
LSPLTVLIGFWGNAKLSRMEVVLVYSFMAFLAHQYEENTPFPAARRS